MDVLLIGRDRRIVEMARKVCAGLAQSPRLQVRDSDEAAQYLFPDNGVSEPHLPALIVMDLNGSGTGEVDLLARTKADPWLRIVPFVVISASPDTADLRRSYLAGANSYVVRPESDQEMEATLRHLFRYWLDVNEPPPPAVGCAMRSRRGVHGRSSA
ncbi:MAG TPA: hypothetical protein PLU39_10615 [Armatimonadota bacterium]|jgi:CheY-like chemotaxis protein|nr:response regulator [Armatimonadota bacterium]HOM81379.1 hypothetical protein [Armatimonadota bacterium]HOQ28706.1 hypothetical protein [Armatimonadota bacterium]HPO72810.1 hypothetical protein [Armatimonadota bacterium]HPT98312.1 hypothetical protein [Armatimonadota bacterium]